MNPTDDDNLFDPPHQIPDAEELALFGHRVFEDGQYGKFGRVSSSEEIHARCERKLGEIKRMIESGLPETPIKGVIFLAVFDTDTEHGEGHSPMMAMGAGSDIVEMCAQAGLYFLHQQAESMKRIMEVGED